MKTLKKIFIFSLLILLGLSLYGCKGDTSLPRSYKVKFVTNNDEITIPSVTVLEGYHITGTSVDLNNLEELITTDAIFRGWYSNEELTDYWNVDTYRVANNMTLYAKWSYPQKEASEIHLSDEAFSNTLSWIQSDADSITDIEVKLLKASVEEKSAIDPNDGSMVIYEVITYPDEAEAYVVNGDFTYNGYFVEYKLQEKQLGGIYKAFITTTNDNGTNTSSEKDIRFKGTGTELDPYLVYTEQDLAYLTSHDFDSSTHAILKNDVTLHSIYSEKKGSIYDGLFNGNGKTVNLLNNSGMFYELGPNSEVYGVKFTGSISGSDPSIGVVANYNSGYIHNCESIAVSITSAGGKVNDFSTLSKGGVGGIVGTNKASGRITLCTITSGQANVISGYIGVGGIAGINYGKIYGFNSTSTPCSAVIGAYNGKEMSLTIGLSYAGCAVGINFGEVYQVNVDGKVNCRRIDLSTNYVTGASNIGGVVGYNAKGATITECLFQGMRCVGDTNVGGIAGFNDGTISSCFTGRRIRKPSGTTVEERMFISPVCGTYNVGGICGKCGENSVITNCFSTANVWCYGMKGYTVAEYADNSIGINTNQNPRLTTNYLGRTYGQVYSNDLTAPIGEGNIILDNTSRINSVEHNLLGAELVDGVNKPNTQLIIKYLTLLGDKFGYNNTYGISLLWQSVNTHNIEYYGG